MYKHNKKRPATIALLAIEKTARKILRSSMETFDWKSKCMFCGGPCQEILAHHFKEQVLFSCQKRSDQINKVALRVRSCNDLVAMEARYHTTCRIKFMNPKKAFYPGEKNAKNLTGKPAENEKLLHFDQLREWIEQEAECYTVKELHQKKIKKND